MRILRIATGIVFLFLLIQGVVFINLMVSDKQEVSLMESYTRANSELTQTEKSARLEKLRERSQEIKREKMIAKITALIILFVFIVLCVILIRKSNANNTNELG